MSFAKPSDRLLVLAGGLCGAAGVAFSAAAAHSGAANVGTAASFLLMHAPALLIVGLVSGSAVLRIGGWLLLAGLLVFAGDLLMRAYAGTRLFPMAAPIGGTTMIVAWLVVAGSAIWQPARK